jgi:hypothetical protein
MADEEGLNKVHKNMQKSINHPVSFQAPFGVLRARKYSQLNHGRMDSGSLGVAFNNVQVYGMVGSYMHQE